MKISLQQKKIQPYLALVLWLELTIYASFAASKPTIVLPNDDLSSAIAFSADGSKLINGRGNCFVWDLKTQQQILTIHSYGATCAAFSPNGKMIATGTDPGLSAIWNTETGEKICAFNYIRSPGVPGPEVISAIVFHPHEPYVITGTSDGRLSKWNIYTGEETHIMNMDYTIYKIQFYPDGDRIVVNQRVISLNSNTVLKEFNTTIRLSYDGEFIFTGKSYIDGMFNKHQFSLYDANSYNLLKKYPVIESSFSDGEYSPDGTFIILYRFADVWGNYDLTKIQLMRLSDGQIVHEFKIEGIDKYIVNKVLFSPDGQQVAVVSEKKIYIWDISDLYSHVTDSENLKK